MENKKILMLTMSCNNPFYKSLLGAVKDTWAKPLIQNKYPNINWFAYTSCDKKHPNPMVDFENNMIYVDVPDDIFHTYEKTQAAWNLIKDKIDFDYVIRTNTSVYINIKNMINHFNNIPNDYIVGRFVNSDIRNIHTGEIKLSFWLMAGFFFGMKKDYFNFCMGANKKFISDIYDASYKEYVDDDIISLRLKSILGDDYPSMHIENTDDDFCITYKPYLPTNDKKEQEKRDWVYKINQFKVFFDPNIVNQYVMIRIRSYYNDSNRSELGHEIEHFYELDECLN